MPSPSPKCHNLRISSTARSVEMAHFAGGFSACPTAHNARTGRWWRRECPLNLIDFSQEFCFQLNVPTFLPTLLHCGVTTAYGNIAHGSLKARRFTPVHLGVSDRTSKGSPGFLPDQDRRLGRVPSHTNLQSRSVLPSHLLRETAVAWR